jgi:hypothetical protein
MDQPDKLPELGSKVIERPYLLTVDGREDVGFWQSILGNRHDIQIEQTGGYSGLGRVLATLVRTPGFRENVR